MKILRKNYLEFIRKNIISPDKDKEIKDLENIFRVLDYRAIYFDELEDKILNDIRKKLKSATTTQGGKFTMLQNPNDSIIYKIYKNDIISYKDIYNTKQNMKTSQSSSKIKSHIDSYVPLYSNTLVRVGDLKEPYLSYYGTGLKSNEYIDISNEGYCVSEK